MLTESPKAAVIYCRVSSRKQVEEGNGLDSQETRCRDFARMRNYEVVEAFHEEGVSGSLINRPGMQAMLKFLKANQKLGDHVVIIDDISRFARGIEAHWQLRTALEKAGGKLESPSIEFGSDPDSILVENLLASVSQHQRQKNAEQVINRMQARFKGGYYLFNKVAGYRYEKIEGHGKMIVPDEPVASIIKEALEGFASRRFETQTEVKRFLEKQPDWKKDKHGEVPFRRVEDLLKNPVYAGYMNSKTWKIKMQKGKHEPLIDLTTWQKNQDRLTAKKVAPIRKDTRPDFPLRGFVCCDECHKPMTACWSKGRSRPYGYYFCQTRDCSQRRKNIRKEAIEGEFETLIRQLRPRQELLDIAIAMLKDLWEDRRAKSKRNKKSYANEITVLDEKISDLVQKMLDAPSQTLSSVYEREIEKHENEKLLLSERSTKTAQKPMTFERTYRTALEFVSNPWKYWDSNNPEDKRTFIRVVFCDRINYLKGDGYRTANLTLLFKHLWAIQNPEYGMVDMDEKTSEQIFPTIRGFEQSHRGGSPLN